MTSIPIMDKTHRFSKIILLILEFQFVINYYLHLLGISSIIYDEPTLYQRMLAGDVPYRDNVDVNQPGIFVIHLSILPVLGKSKLAWFCPHLPWLWLPPRLLSSSSKRRFCCPPIRTAANVSGSVYNRKAPIPDLRGL